MYGKIKQLLYTSIAFTSMVLCYQISFGLTPPCDIEFVGNGAGTALDIVNGGPNIHVGDVDYGCDTSYTITVSAANGNLMNNGSPGPGYAIGYTPSASGATNLTGDSNSTSLGSPLVMVDNTSDGTSSYAAPIISTPFFLHLNTLAKPRAGSYTDTITLTLSAPAP